MHGFLCAADNVSHLGGGVGVSVEGWGDTLLGWWFVYVYGLPTFC
jgi:hypothetical protein